MLEVLVRRFYCIRSLENIRTAEAGGCCLVVAEYDHKDTHVNLIAADCAAKDVAASIGRLNALIASFPAGQEVVVDLFAWDADLSGDEDQAAAQLEAVLNQTVFFRPVRRIVVAMTESSHAAPLARTRYYTYRLRVEGYREEKNLRGLHPMLSERLQLWRLQNFNLERLPSVGGIHLFRGLGRENPRDERLFVIAEVRDLTPTRDEEGRVTRLPHLERMLMESLAATRQVQRQRPPEEKLHWNRILLHIWPSTDLRFEELPSVIRRMARETEGLGLEKVVFRLDMADPQTGGLQTKILSISNPGGRGIVIRVSEPSDQLVRTLSEYDQKVVRMRQRGLTYPYEIIRTLTPQGDRGPADLAPGEFTEMDLDEIGRGHFLR